MSINSNLDCYSQQSFCSLGYQTVGKMMQRQEDCGLLNFTDNTNFLYPINSNLYDISNEDYISPTFYNGLINILEIIQAYGKAGTRNPTTTELNTVPKVSRDSIVTSKEYNNLLKILHQDLNVKDKKIEATLMQQLKDYIKSYNFNTDRCNVCNASAEKVKPTRPVYSGYDGYSCSGCTGGCQDYYTSGEYAGDCCPSTQWGYKE